MNNYNKIFCFFLLTLFCASCEKEAYKETDIRPTEVYRLFHADFDLNVIPEAYELIVYRDIPQLTLFGAKNYVQCVIEQTVNFQDSSDEDTYNFSLDRIVRTEEDGTQIIHHWKVFGYRDRSLVTDPQTGQEGYRESTLTITDETGNVTVYDVEVREALRYLDD